MTVDKEAMEKWHKEWYEGWCKSTGRNPDGSSMLIGSSIYEVTQAYAASLLKENEELKEENQTFRNAFNRADDLINSQINALYASNEAKDRECEYWKARCEAAEDLMNVMDIPKNRSGTANQQWELFGNRNNRWQQLKQKLPQENKKR